MLWIAAICSVRRNTSGIYRISLMPEPQECLAGISAIVSQPGCTWLHVWTSNSSLFWNNREVFSNLCWQFKDWMLKKAPPDRDKVYSNVSPAVPTLFQTASESEETNELMVTQTMC